MFGVKESLIIPYEKIDDPARSEEYGFDGPFYEGVFDFVMKDDASVKDAEAAYSQRASMSGS